ncbi:hypothetical protein DSO57_1031673 [Entomophthora muscae]|uniref:Uncharacterized protein n=1 Tax=Entomophthora muscae TaxID=34485 RepID=A0ACC2T0M5_9FUNG|nr:hypothetical protein DSO57_1031673 [Entomophthora muscae]
MIVGVGTDILKISRISNIVGFTVNQSNSALLWNPSSINKLTNFSSRILSQNELVRFNIEQMPLIKNHNCETPPNYSSIINFLAKRWAVKEALYKALFPKYKLTWKEVELLSLNGKPEIAYHKITPLRKTTHECLDFSQLRTHVSISHDSGLIIAFAVVEKKLFNFNPIEY